MQHELVKTWKQLQKKNNNNYPMKIAMQLWRFTRRNELLGFMSWCSSPQLEVSCAEVSQQHTATTTTKIAKAIIVQIHSVDSIVFILLYFFFGTNYVERVSIYGSSAMNGILCAFKWSSTSMECITQCEYSQCYLAFIIVDVNFVMQFV